MTFNASFCPRLVLSASSFSSAPELRKRHRFLEILDAAYITQGLVQSFMTVELKAGDNALPCFGHRQVSPRRWSACCGETDVAIRCEVLHAPAG